MWGSPRARAAVARERRFARFGSSPVPVVAPVASLTILVNGQDGLDVAPLVRVLPGLAVLVLPEVWPSAVCAEAHGDGWEGYVVSVYASARLSRRGICAPCALVQLKFPGPDGVLFRPLFLELRVLRALHA